MELTLGGKPARFKPIDGLAYLEALTARDAAFADIAQRYPGWAETDRVTSFFRASTEYAVRGVQAPLLIVAWDGDGDPPTVDAILRDVPGRLSCCHEVRRLNDWLTELPAAPTPPGEATDPNA